MGGRDAQDDRRAPNFAKDPRPSNLARQGALLRELARIIEDDLGLPAVIADLSRHTDALSAHSRNARDTGVQRGRAACGEDCDNQYSSAIDDCRSQYGDDPADANGLANCIQEARDDYRSCLLFIRTR
jgi:hypothetical protein